MIMQWFRRRHAPHFMRWSTRVLGWRWSEAWERWAMAYSAPEEPQFSAWGQQLIQLARMARDTQGLTTEAMVQDKDYAALARYWHEALAQSPVPAEAIRGDLIFKVLYETDLDVSMWEALKAAGADWHTEHQAGTLHWHMPHRQTGLVGQAWDGYKPIALRWLLENQVPIDLAHPNEATPWAAFALVTRGIDEPGLWDAWLAHPQCPAPEARTGEWSGPSIGLYQGPLVEVFSHNDSRSDTLQESLAKIRAWDPASWDRACHDTPGRLVGAAVGSSNWPLVRHWLDQGLDPNAPSPNYGRGGTPLHVAARYAHKGAVAMLLEAGADPNARDDAGATPLHWVASRLLEGHGRYTPGAKAKRKLVMEHLLKAGADWTIPVPQGREWNPTAAELRWTMGELDAQDARPNVDGEPLPRDVIARAQRLFPGEAMTAQLEAVGLSHPLPLSEEDA